MNGFKWGKLRNGAYALVKPISPSTYINRKGDYRDVVEWAIELPTWLKDSMVPQSRAGGK